MTKLSLNRRSRRSRAAQRGAVPNRGLSQLEQQYQGLAAQAGTLLARIGQGQQMLENEKRKLGGQSRKLRGRHVARLFRYLTTLVMRGRKAASAQYKSLVPNARLEKKFLDRSIKIGDISYRISRDHVELKKIYGSMLVVTEQGQKVHAQNEDRRADTLKKLEHGEPKP